MVRSEGSFCREIISLGGGGVCEARLMASSSKEWGRAAAERLRSSSSPAIDDGGADTTHSYKTSEYSRQKRGNQALFPFLFLRMSRPRLHALQLGT